MIDPASPDQGTVAREISRQPKFTLQQLQYFAVAADLGSMTAAARELTISQAAISSAISQLERRVGLSLFLRHHARGLSLTPAGVRFLADARVLLSHANEVSDTAQELASAVTGVLVVGCFTSLGPFYIPPLISSMSTLLPDVHVKMHEDEAQGVLQALLSGRCELALIFELDHLPEEIEAETLSTRRPYVIVSPSHRLAGAGAVSLADLAGDPLVLLELPDRREYFRYLVSLAGHEPTVRFRSSNFETVRALVADGHGYALLNHRPATDETYNGGRVVPLQLKDDVAGVKILLVRVRGARLTRRAECFAELARTVVPAVTRKQQLYRQSSTASESQKGPRADPPSPALRRGPASSLGV